jgi:hypothetical protein
MSEVPLYDEQRGQGISNVCISSSKVRPALSLVALGTYRGTSLIRNNHPS